MSAETYRLVVPPPVVLKVTKLAGYDFGWSLFIDGLRAVNSGNFEFEDVESAVAYAISVIHPNLVSRMVVEVMQ